MLYHSSFICFAFIVLTGKVICTLTWDKCLSSFVIYARSIVTEYICKSDFKNCIGVGRDKLFWSTAFLKLWIHWERCWKRTHADQVSPKFINVLSRSTTQQKVGLSSWRCHRNFAWPFVRRWNTSWMGQHSLMWPASAWFTMWRITNTPHNWTTVSRRK